MDLWDIAFIDMLGPGFIRFSAEGSSEFSLGAVQGALDCHYGSHSVYFTWDGRDGMEHVCGNDGAHS